MARTEGYYWVKYDGKWTLTAYIYDSWHLDDGDFEEIDERRITRDVPYYVYQECPDPRCFFTGECQQSFVKNGKCLITPSSPSPSPE